MRDRDLDAISAPFMWHLDALPAARRLLDAARTGFHTDAGFTLLPPGAAHLAHLLSARLDVGDAVFALAPDPALSAALEADGLEVQTHPVTPARPVGGAVAAGLDAPLPAGARARFALVVVDTLPLDDNLTLGLARAVGAARPGGTVAALVHPLARDRLRAAAAFLPLKNVRALHEVAPRALGAARASDILWDLQLFTRTDDALPIAEDAACTLARALDLEAPADGHGSFELHDLDADVATGAALDTALTDALAPLGLSAVATAAHDDDAVSSRVIATGPVQLGVTLDRPRRLAVVQHHPFVARVHLACGRALSDAFGGPPITRFEAAP